MSKKDTGLMLSTVKGPLANLLDNLSGANAGYWLKVVKKILRGENPFAEREAELSAQRTLVLSFIVEVDGTKPYGYGFVRNHNFNEDNFPIKDKTKRTVVIDVFHFGTQSAEIDFGHHPVTTNWMIGKMERYGCRPANTEELVSLAKCHPEILKDLKITTLDFNSAWLYNGRGGDYEIPVLTQTEHGQNFIDLIMYFNGVWGKELSFAGVRIQ
ncbi:hypothetical protein IPF86_00125 [Candidatus Nomurabacteria bacterium]|jgi:hypothetical protein|nr:MAG: hypothetical protein IPF86_00125 [Candidatus Nomurabacteria bacterium]